MKKSAAQRRLDSAGRLCDICKHHPWSAITVATNVKRCLLCFSEYYHNKANN